MDATIENVELDESAFAADPTEEYSSEFRSRVKAGTPNHLDRVNCAVVNAEQALVIFLEDADPEAKVALAAEVERIRKAAALAGAATRRAEIRKGFDPEGAALALARAEVIATEAEAWSKQFDNHYPEKLGPRGPKQETLDRAEPLRAAKGRDLL